ncbi:MAG: hypothetical protein AAF718_08825 [Pseudomonadota bacterium]
MSKAILAHLHRERRRLGFVTSLAFLAGIIFFLPSATYVGSVHISLITGTVYAAVVFVAAAIVCLLLPRLRFMIEAVAVSRLLLACAVLAAPETAKLLLQNPLLMAGVVVLGGALVSRLMHGRLRRMPWHGIALGPASRNTVMPSGTGWQHKFVTWVDGHNAPTREPEPA